MPDHAHALITFPREARMSRVIGEWKHYTAQNPGVDWQSNFFDHRIRTAASCAEKHAYILRNPIIKGLCNSEVQWPWQWPLATAPSP